MTFLGEERWGAIGLGSSACKIPSHFPSESAFEHRLPRQVPNPSDLRRRLGSTERHLPHQIPNPLPALAADRPYTLSGYGGGPNRGVVKVPGSTPGKIPKPCSDLRKKTKSVVRYEAVASDPTAVWRIATAANHKADRVQQQKGDFQKVMTELHESMDRVEAMLQRLVNSQAQTLDQTVGRGVSHLQPSEKSRSVEDLCQINLNSTQGIQLMSTTEGNFKFPSTYPSVVVTGWGEDPLPCSSLASSTWDHQNPSHEPVLVKQWNPNPSKEKVLSAPTVNADLSSLINMKSEQMEQTKVKANLCSVDYQLRRVPGKEIHEQEMYGIDPYTHNCPKEIMLADLDWLIGDKPVFIEVVGLNTLNKQVKHFTGFGNTPMVYPLKPVMEEILKSAEESGDRRIAMMCLGMLKAMRSHPEYNYVAYRKGIGVVCNIRKEMVKVLRSMKPLQRDDVEIGQHKSHHCYFIWLTLEYFKFSSLDSYEFSACKFNSPKHRPYVILSKTITAAYIIYGAILMRQPAGFNPLQFDVVYCSEGYNGYAVVSFNKDWIGFKKALAFQNYLKSKCLGKMDRNETSQQGKYSYGWLAKEEDDKSGDPVDRVLSENGDREEMDGLISLVESGANGDFTLKSDSQFDSAAFYEAIKPLIETGLLEEELPDSLPPLGLYPLRAANWKVQRKKGNTTVSPTNQEYVLCAPYCVPIGFICKNSRVFYNPFNGNVSLQPEYSIVETEEKYICALCLVLTETAQTNICSHATLILCPAPILAQWHYGITRHIRPGSLQFYIYEGARKSDCTSTQKINMTEISIADIVLTTYDVLKEDLSKDPDRHDGDWHFSRFQKRYTVIPTVLTRVRWWRLCLDEAQMVEPSKTSVTEMAMWLKAQHLWCITGTPIQIRCGDPNVCSKILSEEFGWDKDLAQKSWRSGSETTGPNMGVEMCKGVQYLYGSEDSFVAWFQWASKEGALAEENMRVICFEVRDAIFRADAVHKGGGQVILTAKPTLLEPVYLVKIKTLENATLTNVKELGNQNSPEKVDRTTFYYILGLLVFMEDDPVKFRSFMEPLLHLLTPPFPFIDAASRTDVVKYAFIGLMKDLRGIYGFLFDWMYPSRMPLLFKFMYEFVLNKAQGLTFDSSSPNGILLFREISKLIVAYGSRILLFLNGIDTSGSKYKGMWISLTIPSRALCGNYVNFGVFELYGDRALVDSLDIPLKMTLSVPLSDIMAFKKLSKAYYVYGNSVQRSYQFCSRFGYMHIRTYCQHARVGFKGLDMGISTL